MVPYLRSRSCWARSPKAARLPMVPPSSFAQITTSSGWRVVIPRSLKVRTISIAESDPRSPSKFPPLGTESMCEPNRIGLSEASLPARRPKMFPPRRRGDRDPPPASAPWRRCGRLRPHQNKPRGSRHPQKCRRPGVRTCSAPQDVFANAPHQFGYRMLSSARTKVGQMQKRPAPRRLRSSDRVE